MIEKLISWYNSNIDKALHFLASMDVYLLVLVIFNNIFIALGVSCAISILKEVVDQIRYHGWSWSDLLADALGIAIGLFASLI